MIKCQKFYFYTKKELPEGNSFNLYYYLAFLIALHLPKYTFPVMIAYALARTYNFLILANFLILILVLGVIVYLLTIAFLFFFAFFLLLYTAIWYPLTLLSFFKVTFIFLALFFALITVALPGMLLYFVPPDGLTVGFLSVGFTV